MNLETKITIYKFTPQLFTLTLYTPYFIKQLPLLFLHLHSEIRLFSWET